MKIKLCGLQVFSWKMICAHCILFWTSFPLIRSISLLCFPNVRLLGISRLFDHIYPVVKGNVADCYSTLSHFHYHQWLAHFSCWVLFCCGFQFYPSCSTVCSTLPWQCFYWNTCVICDLLENACRSGWGTIILHWSSRICWIIECLYLFDSTTF